MSLKNVTLNDVARLAGVSKGTASLALNGKPVKERTRELILSCATRLNYIPNRIGRTLSTGKSMTIQLLILNSRNYIDLVKEISFFYHMLEGILAVVENHQYSLHFDVKRWEDKGLLHYFDRKAKEKTIDGMIIIPQFIRSYIFLPILQELGVPHIILNSCFRDQHINTLRVNNYLGGRLVAELFIRKGFRKIALINGPTDHYDAMERERGFLEMLRESNIRLTRQAIRHGDFTRNSGYHLMKEILSGHAPDAVFCANDCMAAGAMQSAYKAGMRIPDDLAIVGYDNTDIALAVYPQLTTVDNRVFDSGATLASELFLLIEKNEQRGETSLDPFLVSRGSC